MVANNHDMKIDEVRLSNSGQCYLTERYEEWAHLTDRVATLADSACTLDIL